MICEHCGKEMIKVGHDYHHRVDLFRCGCCADTSKEDTEEIIKEKFAGNQGLAPKSWSRQLEEIRRWPETGEK